MTKLAAFPFMAMAVLGALFMVLGTWEAISIWSGRLPTISETTARAWSNVNTPGRVVILLLAGVVIGALLVHFTGWKALPGTKV